MLLLPYIMHARACPPAPSKSMLNNGYTSPTIFNINLHAHRNNIEFGGAGGSTSYAIGATFLLSTVVFRGVRDCYTSAVSSVSHSHSRPLKAPHVSIRYSCVSAYTRPLLVRPESWRVFPSVLNYPCTRSAFALFFNDFKNTYAQTTYTSRILGKAWVGISRLMPSLESY